MGSKKHKKHHKSEKKDVSFDDRQEKPLKLVLKVGGNVQSPAHTSSAAAAAASPAPVPRSSETPKPAVFEEPKMIDKAAFSGSHSHEKHKKSKKKKKKKSTDKDKERHDRKRKHHHHRHHHREHSHERKEKRRKEQDTNRILTEGHDSRDSLPMRALMESHIMPTEKPTRDARTCTLKKKAMKSPLQILLLYLLKKLQLKDPQEFFAYPVTDMIAPGYSSIIANPIDFCTISKKIDDRDYKTVSEFKADMKLMCDNAMTYNRADTIYYKSAKRMWHVAQKIMNREQLASLKRSFPYMLDLSVDELGFDINDESEESLPGTEIATEPGIVSQPEAKKTKVAPCWNSMVSVDDDDEMSPEEILQQAQKAAIAAKNRLTLKRPNSSFGFLRQHENGTTTLAIIHPKTGEKEVKVNLEMLTGKVSQGTGTIVGFKEDSKNILKPAHYTNYGSYSSYAPYYDSSFSNLSKEDTDLVLSTYGDDTGMQYADSILTYSKDSDYVIAMVDNILNTLTGGEHLKTIRVLEEKRNMKEEEDQARQVLKSEQARKTSPQVTNSTDIESLQTLEEVDLEISRLQNVDNENKKNENGTKSPTKNELLLQKHQQLLSQRRVIQQKLDSATQLLQDLRKVQNERLSSNPPPHLALIRAPSTAEHELADRVTKKLVDVSSHLTPESVVNVESLRKAMGITYHPTLSSDGVTDTNISEQKEKDSDSNNSSTSANHEETVLGHSSPPDVSSGDRLQHQDLETELREFLQTGPVLRVCDSPTGS